MRYCFGTPAVPHVKDSLYTTVLHLGRNEEWYLRVVYDAAQRCEYERDGRCTLARARACARERAESVGRIMCRYRAAASGVLLTRTCLHKSDSGSSSPSSFSTHPRAAHRWASHICTRVSRTVSRLHRYAEERTGEPVPPGVHPGISRGSSAEYARSRQRRNARKAGGEGREPL